MPDFADTLEVDETDRIEAAEALVRSYCGWHITPPRTETVTLAGTGSRTLVLPSLYVTEVESVTDDGDAVDADDYDWSSAGVVTRLNGVWGYGRYFEVEFTHGHEFPPAELSDVVRALAHRGTDNPGRLGSITNGPFSRTYPDGSASEDPILDRYRLIGVA